MVPRTIEQVTPAWLTNVVQPALPGIEVTAARVAPLENTAGYQGNLVRAELTAVSGNRDAPAALVVKMVPLDEKLRGIGTQLGIYLREAAFYRDVGEAAGVPVAHCYGTEIDPAEGLAAIVLEDLTHLRTGDQAAGFTLPDAERAVDAYAAMHARWWGDRDLADFAWLPAWDMPAMVDYLASAYPVAWAGCATLFAGELPAEALALGERLGAHVGDLMRRVGAAPVTLVHGDARHDNLMFDDAAGGPPRFVDWQYCAAGRGTVDIAYYLSQGGAPDIVAPVERDLVARYHAGLRAGGVADYPEAACWEDYRRFALYTLVFPVFTAALIDPESAAQRAALRIILERGFDAAIRLDAAALLGA